MPKQWSVIETVRVTGPHASRLISRHVPYGKRGRELRKGGASRRVRWLLGTIWPMFAQLLDTRSVQVPLWLGVDGVQDEEAYANASLPPEEKLEGERLTRIRYAVLFVGFSRRYHPRTRYLPLSLFRSTCVPARGFFPCKLFESCSTWPTLFDSLHPVNPWSS